MASEENHVTMYQERIVKVETQVSHIIATQDKHNALLEALARQTDSQVYIAKAITDRTETHAKEIESLQAGQVDTGKILVALSGQINRVEAVLKYIGGPIITIIITYLFTNFIK
mgnify:CR=1 FL=1